MPPPTELASRAVALLPSLMSHVLWGLHPVFSRYLQTQAAQPLDPINLLATSQLFALAFNLALTAAQKAWHACRPPPPRAGGSAGAPDGWCDRGWATVRVGFLFGLCGTARAASNICSSRFTYAYNVQLVAMAGPFVTGMMSAALINERLPWTLWPALLAASVGETIVIVAQVGLFGGHATGLHAMDFLGMALQFVSLWFSGLARIMMKSSTTSLGPMELMAFQYLVCIFPGFVYSYAVLPADRWRGWLHLAPKDYIVFASITVGIFVIAASMQVVAIRLSGPGAHAALQPIRLVVTVLGSVLVLDESLTSPMEWLGMFIVVVVMAWYVVKGRKMGTPDEAKLQAPGPLPYTKVAQFDDLDRSNSSNGSNGSDSTHIELADVPTRDGGGSTNASPLHDEHRA